LIPVTSFISGISFVVFCYCVRFLEQMNSLGLLLIIAVIGLVVFIPHFFILQLLRSYIMYPVSSAARNYFLAAIIICVSISLYLGYAYKQALRDIEQFKNSNYTHLNTTFFTEKILGMHFIYHT